MFEQLKEIMATKFQLAPADIQPESTLKDLELDSLDVVELSLVLEKEFDIKITDDELAEAQQVGRIVELIQSRSATV